MAPAPVSPWVMSTAPVSHSTRSIAPTILLIVSSSRLVKSRCALTVVVSKFRASLSLGITFNTNLSSSDFS